MEKLLLLVMRAIFHTANMQIQTEKWDKVISVNATPFFGKHWTTVCIGFKHLYCINIKHSRMLPNCFFKKYYAVI